MKHFAALVIVVGGLAASAARTAGAANADSWEPTPPTTPFPGSAPSPDTADAVITRLQNNAYKVILNKVGAAPLDQCKVTSVTPGQQVTTPVTGGGGGINQQVLFTTVYVTADCTTSATPEPAKPGR
jgi:hypothetical protein